MADEETLWLSHLKGDPIHEAKAFDSFLISLEAWRRGLDVRFHGKPSQEFLKSIDFNKTLNGYFGILYSISSKEKTHYFYSSGGDKNSFESYYNQKNKPKAKKLFLDAGLPVAEGKEFNDKAKNDEVIEYAKSLGFPVVLKPSDSDSGKGVFADIKDLKSFSSYLYILRNKLGFKNIMVEKHIKGKDCRIYLVNGEIISAVTRIPANIVGDGRSSINALIELKNKVKKCNPHLSTRPIVIDAELRNYIKRIGYNINSVPKDGEKLQLKGKCNATAGGDTLDITDEISAEIKNIATKALQALGVIHGVLDMIVDYDNTGRIANIIILEINSCAVLGSHVFPYIGQARDVPRAIIDFYFPETKGLFGNHNYDFYFNYNLVKQQLKNGKVNEVIVNPPPGIQIKCKKKFLVDGKVQKVGYRYYLKKKALELRLHGYVKNLENGKVEIVVCGESEKKVSVFEDACKIGPERAKVDKLTSYSFDDPIKVGFEIKSDIKSTYEKIKQTKFWASIKPLRVFVRKIFNTFSLAS